MRLFGEVDEALGAVFRGLHFFEVGDDFFEEGEGGEEADFELFAVRDAVFLRADEVEEDFGEAVEFAELGQAFVLFGPCGAVAVEELEVGFGGGVGGRGGCCCCWCGGSGSAGYGAG